jgi:hypothetical protein
MELWGLCSAAFDVVDVFADMMSSLSLLEL